MMISTITISSLRADTWFIVTLVKTLKPKERPTKAININPDWLLLQPSQIWLVVWLGYTVWAAVSCSMAFSDVSLDEQNFWKGQRPKKRIVSPARTQKHELFPPPFVLPKKSVKQTRKALNLWAERITAFIWLISEKSLQGQRVVKGLELQQLLFWPLFGL